MATHVTCIYSASSFCPVSSTGCVDMARSLSIAAEDFLREGGGGAAW